MYSDSDQEFEEVKVSRTLDEDCDVTDSRVRWRSAWAVRRRVKQICRLLPLKKGNHSKL
jgi:hypothetical protein